MTDDARIVAALLRSGGAETAWSVARKTGLDEAVVVAALRRMTADTTNDYPVLPRWDLGPDVYEATEDSDRTWS